MRPSPAPSVAARRPRAAALVSAAVATALLAFAAAPAEAHRTGGRHHGWRTSVYVGVGPLWYRPYGWYGPVGYYAAPPVVVAAPGPTVWIERSDLAPQPPAGFWYWCDAANAYWPSVQTCTSAWVPVAPRADAGAPQN